MSEKLLLKEKAVTLLYVALAAWLCVALLFCGIMVFSALQNSENFSSTLSGLVFIVALAALIGLPISIAFCLSVGLPVWYLFDYLGAHSHIHAMIMGGVMGLLFSLIQLSMAGFPSNFGDHTIQTLIWVIFSSVMGLLAFSITVKLKHKRADGAHS